MKYSVGVLDKTKDLSVSKDVKANSPTAAVKKAKAFITREAKKIGWQNAAVIVHHYKVFNEKQCRRLWNARKTRS